MYESLVQHFHELSKINEHIHDRILKMGCSFLTVLHTGKKYRTGTNDFQPLVPVLSLELSILV